jgi:hypothetical protein
MEKEKSSGWTLTTSLMWGGTACRCFIAFLLPGFYVKQETRKTFLTIQK